MESLVTRLSGIIGLLATEFGSKLYLTETFLSENYEKDKLEMKK